MAINCIEHFLYLIGTPHRMNDLISHFELILNFQPVLNR